MKTPPFRKHLALATLALICASALVSCRPSSQHAWSYTAGGNRITAEDLLDSDGGPWTMVEEDDPIAAHAQAKKAQNPRNMRGMVHQGIDYDLAKGEQTYARTVRLVRKGDEGAAPPEEGSLAMAPARTDLILDSGAQEQAADIPPAPERKPDYQPQEQEEIAAVQPAPDKPERKPRFEPPREEPRRVAPLAEKVSNETRGAVEISALRFGAHPGKVRMVFDMTGPASFQHTLDNGAHELSIEIAHADWDAGRESEILNSPLIEGYRVTQSRGGARVDLRLKKPVKILWAAALKPEGGKGDRLVLDIAAL